jgi:hypothetical protein
MSKYKFVLPNVLRGERLLGKPFLASICASMNLRDDFLSVPNAKGVPIVISARRYLGYRGRRRWLSGTILASPVLDSTGFWVRISARTPILRNTSTGGDITYLFIIYLFHLV